MDDQATPPRSPRIRAWHLALLLAPSIFLVSLGTVPLQLPDEPREAAIALEMWHNGPISVPRVNGEFHAVKPPVMYWAASAFYALFRSPVPSELAVRLAPALFTIGSLLLVLAFGRLWFSFRHGALALCALALSPEMISHGRRFMTDPALSFFVTACVGCALTSLHREKGRLPFTLLSGVALGLGFLSKGPVAVILSGLAIAGAVAASRGPRGFWSRPVLELYGAYVLFLGPAVGYWLWLLHHEGGKDLVDFWVNYHRGGAKGEEGTPHLKPFYFYVTRGSDGVMPWIFFLPLLAYRRPPSQPPPASRGEEPGRAPLLREIGLWSLLPLLFLSALAQKRDLYTLPLLAPVALLAAVAILDAPSEGPAARIGKAGWLLLQAVSVLLAVAGAGAGLVGSILLHDTRGVAVAVALLVAGAAVVVVARSDPDERSAPLPYPFATMALGSIFAIALIAFVEPGTVTIGPIRSQRMENTLRPTMRAIVAEVAKEPGAVLHGYKLGDGTAVVNGALTLELGGRFPDATTPKELEAVLRDPHARVVIRKAGYDEVGRPGRIVAEIQGVKREGRHGEADGWKHEYLIIAPR